MSTRRSHYEIAFERYLDLRGTPYVPVEDVRTRFRSATAAKSFDYIVYPPVGRPCLVDVKGRKTTRLGPDGDCRQKNWVTRADVHDLLIWQDIFGDDFLGVFAFGYWLAAPQPRGPHDVGLDADDCFVLAGRRYSFWLAPVEEYAHHQKPLSRSWDTVSIPKAVFLRITRKLEQCWTPAPC